MGLKQLPMLFFEVLYDGYSIACRRTLFKPSIHRPLFTLFCALKAFMQALLSRLLTVKFVEGLWATLNSKP